MRILDICVFVILIKNEPKISNHKHTGNLREINGSVLNIAYNAQLNIERICQRRLIILQLSTHVSNITAAAVNKY